MLEKTRETKVFVGLRTRGSVRVWVQTRSSMFPLNPHNDVRDHSPDGFEWGYGGSGPAQLALAICLELLEGPNATLRALRCYQDVKWRFIGTLEGDTWQLDGAEVLAYLSELENNYAAHDIRSEELRLQRLEDERKVSDDARVRQALGDMLPGEEEPT